MVRVALARGGELLARFGIGEALRAEALAAVDALRAAGVQPLMLTGDTDEGARAVAESLLDARLAGLSPEDKVERIEALGVHVAMVGDGLNDAPALAGIGPSFAVEGGTGLARGMAQVTLLHADLRLVPWTHRARSPRALHRAKEPRDVDRVQRRLPVPRDDRRAPPGVRGAQHAHLLAPHARELAAREHLRGAARRGGAEEMIDSALVTALGMGALGSLHCAAMCGPLVVAGCSQGEGVDRGAAAGYFGARLLAYATVGAVMGHLGKHALCILPMGVVQTVALVVVAGFAVARGVAALRARPASPTIQLRVPGKRPRRSFYSMVGELLPKRGAALGAATAILPCGILVPAWVLAASTSSPAAGAGVMAVFALATAPGLLVPLAGRRLLAGALRRLPRTAHGVAWLVLAAWIAVRPLLIQAHVCH